MAVTVRMPDGRILELTEEEARQAEKAGAVRVEVKHATVHAVAASAGAGPKKKIAFKDEDGL